MNSSLFTDTRLIEFPQANPFVLKILRRYHLQIDPEPAPSALVDVRISLPNGSALLWDRATSLPRSPLRRKLLRSVSLTLQNALRCWIPYLWLSYPEHWQDRDLLWPMLIYASSRTFKPRSRDSYTFDLLSDTTLPSILRSCLPTLRDWMPLLQAINHDRPLARREFRNPRLLDVIERMDFNPHSLKRLLAHEHKLITAFTEFADSHAENPSIQRFGSELHRHLNRLYTNVDFSFLAPLLHIETENTVAVHLLEQPILGATISLTEPSPGTRPFRLPRPGFTYHQAQQARVSRVQQPNRGPSVHPT